MFEIHEQNCSHKTFYLFQIWTTIINYDIDIDELCFNSIISAYIESNHLDKAVNIFLSFTHMFEGKQICLKLLSSCIQTKSLNYGQIIHKHILNNNHNSLKHNIEI